MVGNNVIITHHFFNASIRETLLKNKEYEIIQIKGFGYETEIGKPQLPGYTDIIPISNDNTAIQVSQSDYIEYTGFNIVPAQKQTVDSNVNESVFMLDKSVYNNSQLPRRRCRG